MHQNGTALYKHPPSEVGVKIKTISLGAWLVGGGLHFYNASRCPPYVLFFSQKVRITRRTQHIITLT